MAKRKKGPRNLAAVVNRQKRLAKIEECLLRGYTSQQGLAAKFGVSQAMISYDITKIVERWKTQSGPDDLASKRARRIKQLEYVIQLAHDAYQRSRGDKGSAEMNKHEVCRQCEGIGIKGGDFCAECEGNGWVDSVTITVRKEGDAGDPNWLALVRACIQELNRIEGTYAPSRRTVQKNTTVTGEVVHRNETEVKLLEYASTDALIAAKVAMNAVKQNALQNAKTIDGTAVTVEEKTESVDEKKEEGGK